MTRAEVLELYDVNEHGIITSPGKFEGEMVYCPAFWDASLNGCADVDDGPTQKFKLTAEDRAEWPELKGRHWLTLYESEQGFVSEL